MLRLPLTVAPVFLEWLERTQSMRAARIESRIRDVSRRQAERSAVRRTRVSGRRRDGAADWRPLPTIRQEA